MLIGLIADTHGLMRPDVASAFAGVDRILHAGDVGGRDVLWELGQIAPVDAVLGNTDPFELMLPPVFTDDIGDLVVTLTHGHALGSPRPDALARRYPAADVIVFGHTHQPLVERVGRALVINPGAAGPRRFKLAPSVARLRIEDGKADVEIVSLAI
jgi:uncharacterized protein